MMLVWFSLKSQSSTQNGPYITALVFVSLLFNHHSTVQLLAKIIHSVVARCVQIGQCAIQATKGQTTKVSIQGGTPTGYGPTQAGRVEATSPQAGGLGRVAQQKITRFSLAREMNKGDLFLLLYRLCGTLEWYEIGRNYRLVCIPSRQHTSPCDNQIIALSVPNWGC